jgi:hypothetical protein
LPIDQPDLVNWYLEYTMSKGGKIIKQGLSEQDAQSLVSKLNAGWVEGKIA